MQTLDELNAGFEIEGVLSFEVGEGGLLRARVTTAAGVGEVYLHGAHVTGWQPTGHAPVIFVSRESLYAPGKPIRGGVPLIFPWFGSKDGAPTHGFVRTEVWDVAFAAVSGDAVHLTLTFAATDATRALGYDNFRLAYEVVFGRELTLRLSVANLNSKDGDEKPLEFEEGLHTYFAVGDVQAVGVVGLMGTDYLDKMDGFKRKTQTEEVLRFTGAVDRPYLNTEADVAVIDDAVARKIVVKKVGSKTTVVWNPAAELAEGLPDLGDDEWRKFVCVETVNASENKLTLMKGEAHTMEAKISVGSVRA